MRRKRMKTRSGRSKPYLVPAKNVPTEEGYIYLEKTFLNRWLMQQLDALECMFEEKPLEQSKIGFFFVQIRFFYHIFKKFELDMSILKDLCTRFISLLASHDFLGLYEIRFFKELQLLSYEQLIEFVQQKLHFFAQEAKSESTYLKAALPYYELAYLN